MCESRWLLERCDELCALRDYLEGNKSLGRLVDLMAPLASSIKEACLAEMRCHATLDYSFRLVNSRSAVELNEHGILSNCSLKDWSCLPESEFTVCLRLLAESVCFLLNFFLATTENRATCEMFTDDSFIVHIRRAKSLKMSPGIFVDCGSDIAEPPRMC